MVTLDEFLEHVAISGLIRAARLEQARAQLEPGGAEDAWLRLAKRLIGQGLLTSYQGRKLLAGATRGFLLGGYRILRPLAEDSASVLSIRDLGDPEPTHAPRHRAVPPSIPASVRSHAESAPRPAIQPSDSRWLLPFSLLVLGLGLIAILAIALLSRG